MTLSHVCFLTMLEHGLKKEERKEGKEEGSKKGREEGRTIKFKI